MFCEGLNGGFEYVQTKMLHYGAGWPRLSRAATRSRRKMKLIVSGLRIFRPVSPSWKLFHTPYSEKPGDSASATVHD